MLWINGKCIFQGKVRRCLMQGAMRETERRVSVKLQFIYRSAFKLQKIQSVCAEPVKMNITAYQHRSSEGITGVVLIHKALITVTEGQAGRKSKQIISIHTCISQGNSIPLPKEFGIKPPSNGLWPRLKEMTLREDACPLILAALACPRLTRDAPAQSALPELSPLPAGEVPPLFKELNIFHAPRKCFPSLDTLTHGHDVSCLQRQFSLLKSTHNPFRDPFIAFLICRNGALFLLHVSKHFLQALRLFSLQICLLPSALLEYFAPWPFLFPCPIPLPSPILICK